VARQKAPATLNKGAGNKGAEGGPVDQGSGVRWWAPQYAGAKRHEAASRWLARVRERANLRQRVHLLNAHLYEDVSNLGLGPYQYSVYDLGTDRLRMNAVRAVTDTYVSLITSSKPKPRVLTNDGNWSLKKKAKGLQRWFEGQADAIHLYRDVSNPCCLDSAVFGLGIAKVYRENPENKEHWDVGVERAFPWELDCDDAEAQFPARIRNLAHSKFYDRSVAAEMFGDTPELKQWILTHAPRYGTTNVNTVVWAVDSAADLICISELWHLPSCEGMDEADCDGVHTIICEGKTLYDGPWTRRRFPFAFLYRSRPTMGLWGVSIAHEIRGMHTHINQSLFDHEEVSHLYGKPKLLYPAGSIDPNHWSDEVDEMIPFNGPTPPIVYAGQIMPADFYGQLWTVWQKCFEQIGMTAEAGKGSSEAGIDASGAAVRARADTRDGRMFRASENFQDWHMQIAELMIDEARDIAKEKSSYATAWRGKTSAVIVKFRDVDPGRDRYFIQTWPESRLSKDPSARFAQLQERFNSGLITPAEFRELEDLPDLEAEDNLLNAPRQLAEKLIERFLEADDPSNPDVMTYPESDWPLHDTPMGPGIMTRLQLAKVRASLDGCPYENIALITQFLSLCDAVLAKAAAAAAPPPGAPGAGPPGGGIPGAPPTLPQTAPTAVPQAGLRVA
jgi:hypothetical protein